jgi:hypothetical protein
MRPKTWIQMRSVPQKAEKGNTLKAKKHPTTGKTTGGFILVGQRVKIETAARYELPLLWVSKAKDHPPRRLDKTGGKGYN